MIKEFNEVEVRRSGIIYRSLLTQIKTLYSRDAVKAGELAISAIEQVLTGQISSDDAMISIMLEPSREIEQSVQEKYEAKLESSRQKKIQSQRLDEIAELVNMGCTQREIGNRLGLSQQTVSNRVKLMRVSYPELLQENKNCTNFVQDFDKKKVCTNFVQNSTTCTNVDNFVQTCADEEFVKQEESPKVASYLDSFGNRFQF